MKKAWSALIALLLALGLGACTSTDTESPAGADVLVVEGYGAEYQPLFDEVIAKPFTAKTGIQIKYTAGGSAGERYASIRASNGDPGFDVGIMTGLELYQGSQDHLLAPVTPEQVPNLAHLSPKLLDNTYGVGAIQDVQQVVLMYNKKQFSKPPTSWGVAWEKPYRSGALLFNPNNIIGVYQMLSAAELDGGSITNTAPGFARITDLAPDALGTPQASAEAVPFMTKGTASVFPYLDGRAAIYAKTTDYDFTVPKEGTYASLGSLAVPTGAAHKEQAYKFIDFWLSNEVQQKWAQAYNVGPAVTGLEFPADFSAKHVTTTEQLDKLKIADSAIVMKNRSAWKQQWSEAVK